MAASSDTHKIRLHLVTEYTAMTIKDVKPKGPAPATLPVEPKTEELKNSKGPAPFTRPKQPE